MIGRDLHLDLAVLSLVAMAGVAAEGVWRVLSAGAPGRLASIGSTASLLLLGVTAAGGLGILLGGGRPRVLLHFVYAGLALGSVPVADSIARASTPRRQAAARAVAALIGVVVIARLFGTG